MYLTNLFWEMIAVLGKTEDKVSLRKSFRSIRGSESFKRSGRPINYSEISKRIYAVTAHS